MPCCSPAAHLDFVQYGKRSNSKGINPTSYNRNTAPRSAPRGGMSGTVIICSAAAAASTATSTFCARGCDSCNGWEWGTTAAVAHLPSTQPRQLARATYHIVLAASSTHLSQQQQPAASSSSSTTNSQQPPPAAPTASPGSSVRPPPALTRRCSVRSRLSRSSRGTCRAVVRTGQQYVRPDRRLRLAALMQPSSSKDSQESTNSACSVQTQANPC